MGKIETAIKNKQLTIFCFAIFLFVFAICGYIFLGNAEICYQTQPSTINTSYSIAGYVIISVALISTFIIQIAFFNIIFCCS